MPRYIGIEIGTTKLQVVLGEPLRSGVAQKLPGFITEAYKPGPEVRLSALGEDVVSTGALLLARQCAQ